MKCLVVGPDNGLEFGWFLMRWQAKIRFLSRQYDKTFVISDHERFRLYADFAIPYYLMNRHFDTDMWRFKGCVPTYIQPSKEYCCSDGNDEFISYDAKKDKDNKCIVVHMRKKDDGREWGIRKWKEFCNSLNEITNLPIVAIGQVENTHECTARGVDSAIHFLNNAVLAIGPSSGPMHLASLCGCPHLVWSDDKVWNLGVKKGTNRERYETVWNPFKTTAIVIDNHGWNPPVQIILDETEKWLKNVA